MQSNLNFAARKLLSCFVIVLLMLSALLSPMYLLEFAFAISVDFVVTVSLFVLYFLYYSNEICLRHYWFNLYSLYNVF